MSVDVRSVVMSTSHPGGARLRVSGDLDGPSADRLRALLDDVVAPGAHVQVDLSRAGWLPVDVLRALAAAHRRLGDGAGSFVLVGPSPAAARALRISGLDRALSVCAAPEPGASAPGPGSRPPARPRPAGPRIETVAG